MSGVSQEQTDAFDIQELIERALLLRLSVKIEHRGDSTSILVCLRLKGFFAGAAYCEFVDTSLANVARLAAQRLAGPILKVDDEACLLSDFLVANQDDNESCDIVKALEPGQKIELGGGAWASFTVERVL